MFSIHVFAQYKLSHEALAALTPDQQADVDRARLGSRWSRDASGNLLSPLLPLPLPRPEQPRLTHDLAFEWPDSATRALALSAAQPQLLVCEVLGIADRNDLAVYLQGVVSDEDGEPLVMYSAVPQAITAEAKRQMQTVIGRTGASVTAYRAVSVGETVRTLELQTTVRKRDRRLQKVKAADVYDFQLERPGTDGRVLVSRRATLRETGSSAPPQPVLAGSAMRRLMLHALSGISAAPYAVLDGQTPPAPATFASSLLRSLTEAPPPPPAPRPKPAPVPPPPAPEDAAPAPAVPAPPPPPPLSPAPDPWLTLTERMAVDPQVVEVARKTLERSRPLLLRGAPGVGKTLLATLLAEALCGEGNYTLVTADARWTSSEVVGGLRVAPGDTLRYAFMPGVVTRAAQRHLQSLQSTGRPHALIIDEFNRAHQDEAFGRLLTLLDPRYRSQLPLVGPDDGAAEEVFLPPDFLLIGTLNDADTARLHDLSAALQRRFTSVQVSVPVSERAYLQRKYSGIPQKTFDALYGVVGTGGLQDRPQGRLRGAVMVGTHFMSEVLEYVQTGMTLDAALSTLIRGYLAHLTQADLEQLAAHAGQHGLRELQLQVEQARTTVAF